MAGGMSVGGCPASIKEYRRVARNLARRLLEAFGREIILGSSVINLHRPQALPA